MNLPISQDTLRPAQESQLPCTELLQRIESADFSLASVMEFRKEFAELVQPSAIQRFDTKISTDADRVLKYVVHATKTISLLSYYSSHLNQIARCSPERNSKIGVALMPLAAAKIATLFNNYKQSGGGNVRIPDIKQESIVFAIAYQKACKGIRTPKWHVVLNDLLEITNVNQNLPGILTYLANSKSFVSARGLSRLKARLDEADEASKKAATKYKVYGSQENEDAINDAASARQKIEAEAIKAIKSADDIDPRNIVDCANAIEIETAPKAEVLNAILSFYHAVNKSIVNLAESKESSTVAFSDIPNLEFRSVDPSRMSAQVVRNLLSLKEGVDPSKKEDLFIGLVDCFVALRSALMNIYDQLDYMGTQDIELKHTKRNLDKALASVFEGEGNTSLVLGHLSDLDSKRLEGLIAQLLISKTVPQIPGSGQPRFAIESPENLKLVGILVEHLIFGDAVSVDSLNKSLDDTTLRPVIHLSKKLREMINGGRISEVSDFFDKKIEENDSKDSRRRNNLEIEGLLFAMSTLSSKPQFRNRLKDRLKNLKQTEALCHSAIEGRKGSPLAAKTLEEIRVRISRNFSSTLDDYLGQAKRVADLIEMTEDNLLLLDNPEEWAELSPEDVYINEVIICGPPGVGKTYLVECWRNTYGFPVVELSLEEMSASSGIGSDAPLQKVEVKKIEAEFSSFLEKKAEEAGKLMAQVKAKMCIMLMDEVEAKFLKRNPKNAERKEIERTNIMLRVLEKIKKKYPQLFFVGITNHLKLVDGAAKRLGRFGIKIMIDYPDKEGIIGILRYCFDRLKLDTEDIVDHKKFEAELIPACEEATPLVIKKAIMRFIVLAKIRKKELSLDEKLNGLVNAVKALRKLIHEDREEDLATESG